MVDRVPSSMGGSDVGDIKFTARSVAPPGWLLCYGQALSRSTYSDLFAAISTTYGTGDGSTTFNIPDFRGRVACGKDNMGGSAASRMTNAGSGVDGATLGATGGAETHVLTTTQMPAHTHGLTSAAGAGGNAAAGGLGYGYPTTGTTGSQGSGGSHNNTQPTMIVNALIYTGV